MHCVHTAGSKQFQTILAPADGARVVSLARPIESFYLTLVNDDAHRLAAYLTAAFENSHPQASRPIRAGPNHRRTDHGNAVALVRIQRRPALAKRAGSARVQTSSDAPRVASIGRGAAVRPTACGSPE